MNEVVSNIKIVILCSDDYHHNYLINYFCKRHNIVAVVVEPYKNLLSNLLKKKKYKDWFYYKYHSLRRKIVGYDRYRRNYFKIEDSTINEPSILLTRLSQKPGSLFFFVLYPIKKE
jgi:hypothetical protein